MKTFLAVLAVAFASLAVSPVQADDMKKDKMDKMEKKDGMEKK